MSGKSALVWIINVPFCTIVELQGGWGECMYLSSSGKLNNLNYTMELSHFTKKFYEGTVKPSSSGVIDPVVSDFCFWGPPSAGA